MGKTRVNLLFGFLGSGKTTLVQRIIEEFGAARRLAIIINEFGAVNVDGEILSGNNIDMIQLSSGCLCCTLKGPLLAAIAELAENSSLDHIVIEATGIAEPEEMLISFADPHFIGKFELGPLVTVVDTPKFRKIRSMLGPFYEAQIENADIVILNKIDLTETQELADVHREVFDLNNSTLIHYAERCHADLASILDGAASVRHTLQQNSDMDAQADPSHEHEHSHDHEALHAPAESFILEAPETFNRSAIETLFASAPDGLWRSKGFIRIEGSDWLVQFAMGELEITPCAPQARHFLVFLGDGLDQNWFQRGLEAAHSNEKTS